MALYNQSQLGLVRLISSFTHTIETCLEAFTARLHVIFFSHKSSPTKIKFVVSLFPIAYLIGKLTSAEVSTNDLIF